ncbi:MAG: zeta toxin family protein [Pirellulales bacterium]
MKLAEVKLAEVMKPHGGNKMPRRVFIIAGPNGAGKTTFAREFLPREADCPNFVNADLIAAGLAPFQPDVAAIRAGRLMLAEIRRHVAERANFAFETTLSGRTYAKMIPRWRNEGYGIELIFLKLRSVRISVKRVRERVRQGGHSVPLDVIRRRFRAGWDNYESLYRPLADRWELYDNSGDAPKLLDWGENP